MTTVLLDSGPLRLVTNPSGSLEALHVLPAGQNYKKQTSYFSACCSLYTSSLLWEFLEFQ